jgi:hypothetical protein
MSELQQWGGLGHLGMSIHEKKDIEVYSNVIVPVFKKKVWLLVSSFLYT